MQLVDDVESHIFRHGFYENYERWIYHGESEEGHVNMQGQNEGLVAKDEMADVLNDVVGDDSPAVASQSNRRKFLSIDFDTKEGTYLPTRENQKYLSRVVGTRVRQFVHPYFDRWVNVPEEQNARATGCIYESFDVNPRCYSKADYKLVVDDIEDTAARRYRQYKANVNAYIRDKGTTVPYRGLTADV
ncbi:hypothetical protein Adt_19625 [Abeliophyllum distichum]|uniref:Transposase n=1 Tax=Abeliophyllum distichum TaxID=126358 RepID=A0ABD1STH6_9LAMI